MWFEPRWDAIREWLRTDPDLTIIHVVGLLTRENYALRGDFGERYHAVVPGGALMGRRVDEIVLDVSITPELASWISSNVLCRLPAPTGSASGFESMRGMS